MIVRRFLCVVLGLSLHNLSDQVSLADHLRTVVLADYRTTTGNVVPGLHDSTTFARINSPDLNNQGQVSFVATLRGEAVDDRTNSALFSETRPGELALVARGGQPVPPENDMPLFAAFDFHRQSSSTQIAFRSLLRAPDGTPTDDSGYFTRQPGSDFSTLARQREMAPTRSGEAIFERFDRRSTTFSSNGHLAFGSTLSGPDVDDNNNYAIFTLRDHSSLVEVVRSGDEVPGTQEATFLEFGHPSVNDQGRVAFQAEIHGASIDRTNNESLWAESNETGLKLIAREGDSADAAGEHATFGNASFHSRAFSKPRFYDNGRITFLSRIIDPTSDLVNDSGIFSGRVDDSNLSLIARTGDTIPESGSLQLGSFRDEEVLSNNKGNVAFRAFVSGPGVDNSNDLGIFTKDSEGLKLVAREGDPVPIDGEEYYFTSFNRLSYNRLGQALFFASFASNDGENSNSALFAQDIAGNLKIIALRGSTINVSNDDELPNLRTIHGISYPFAGVQINDIGQVAFLANFRSGPRNLADGTSGLFVSNLVAIPEPSSLVLLLIATLFPLRWRQC